MPKQKNDARTAKGRSRRNFLKGSAALGAAIAAPAILKTSPRQARADENTIRIIGPNVIALEDWTAFTAETGLTVEWKGIASDPGVFLKEAIATRPAKTSTCSASTAAWKIGWFRKA